MINHLFTVACGLDSAALGKTKILGQLKAAFRLSDEAGAARRVMRPLMQRAFRVSKKIRTESELGRRGLSVAGAAVRRASKLGAKFERPKILIIGAGQMAESICKGINHLRFQGEVVICSRTDDRASALAKVNGFTAAPAESLETNLLESDIIFCAASVSEPIIGRTLLQRLLIRR